MSPYFAIEWSAWFEGVNCYIATFLIAMLPLAELRGSIPYAVLGGHIEWWKALLVSIVGNMVPVFFILWLLEPVSAWLMAHSRIFERFFNWLFARTRRKLEKKYELYEGLALTIFVSIPLPVTGAWTGSVAAFVFGIPYRKALFWIFLGVCIAGAIVTTLVISGTSLFRIFVGYG